MPDERHARDADGGPGAIERLRAQLYEAVKAERAWFRAQLGESAAEQAALRTELEQVQRHLQAERLAVTEIRRAERGRIEAEQALAAARDQAGPLPYLRLVSPLRRRHPASPRRPGD